MFVGMDVHRNRTQVCVLDRKGIEVRNRSVSFSNWQRAPATSSGRWSLDLDAVGPDTSPRTSLCRPGHPRPAPARLRSTWLLTHLVMGTRLPELCRAAGLLGVTVLSDLLEHVEPLNNERAAAMLRGSAP